MDSQWVVMLAAAGALVLGVAGSMTRAARHGATWQSRVEARWRQAAERIGAKLEISSHGMLSPRRLAMVLDVDDAVAVAEVNVPVDPGAPSHTRARARFVLGGGPRFRIWEGGGVSDPAGAERTILGDGPLAGRVRIETDRAEATKALFSSAVSAHAASFRRRIALRSDGHTVTLLWDGVELDGDVLANALRLVAEVARSGTALLNVIAKLDGASYVPVSEGGPLVRVRREQAEVDLVAEASASGPAYAARAASRRSTPAFRVHIDAEGSVDGAIPTGLIDPQLAPSFGRVGAAALECRDDRVELAWDAPPTPEQADAGLRLVASIISNRGRDGAFR